MESPSIFLKPQWWFIKHWWIQTDGLNDDADCLIQVNRWTVHWYAKMVNERDEDYIGFLLRPSGWRPIRWFFEICFAYIIPTYDPCAGSRSASFRGLLNNIPSIHLSQIILPIQPSKSYNAHFIKVLYLNTLLSLYNPRPPQPEPTHPKWTMLLLSSLSLSLPIVALLVKMQSW